MPSLSPASTGSREPLQELRCTEHDREPALSFWIHHSWGYDAVGVPTSNEARIEIGWPADDEWMIQNHQAGDPPSAFLHVQHASSCQQKSTTAISPMHFSSDTAYQAPNHKWLSFASSSGSCKQDFIQTSYTESSKLYPSSSQLFGQRMPNDDAQRHTFDSWKQRTPSCKRKTRTGKTSYVFSHRKCLMAKKGPSPASKKKVGMRRGWKLRRCSQKKNLCGFRTYYIELVHV